MRIESSCVSMCGRATRQELRAVSETFQVRPTGPLLDRLELSPEARDLLSESSNLSSKKAEEVPASREEQRAKMLETLLSYMLKKPVKITVPKLNGNTPAQSGGQSGERPQLVPREQVGGFSFTREEFVSIQETQQLRFAGTINTSDGKQVSFRLELNVAQSFTFYQRTDVQVGNKVDPLVINFDAPLAALEGTRFAFDLNVDGTEDNIPMLRQGSGWLALDKNGDGRINDGSELFGALTGDGFRELAQHDEDGNGWIDEGDSVYERLSVWVKNGPEDRMYSLKDKGIGAIYLGNLPLQYGKYTGNGQLSGIQQRAGFYLRENGTAGTVQHIDVIV